MQMDRGEAEGYVPLDYRLEKQYFKYLQIV